MDIEGIYCPVTTPFVDDRIATDKLAGNLEKWDSLQLTGYVLLGSTGETPLLTLEEKIELIRAVCSSLPKEKQLIVGTGLESTSETIEFARRVAEPEVDAVLVLTPNYYEQQMNERVLRHHFVSVAEDSPLPLILYNVPPFTGVDMPAELIAELSGHPNIVGIKDSTTNFGKWVELMKLSSPNFKVLLGNATVFLPGLFMGADGAILAICNIVAKECVQIYDYFEQGSFEQARQLFFRILPLITDVVTPYGVPAIKAAMDLLGYYGGPVRKPLLPADEALLESIKLHLRKAELI
ncbi:dihydrodipicolinate synthase family protein [candidate division KSB1 bacterium]|nr:dihydrodipicolinate synthase family protein [candidate division KSB1 bacterium]